MCLTNILFFLNANQVIDGLAVTVCIKIAVFGKYYHEIYIEELFCSYYFVIEMSVFLSRLNNNRRANELQSSRQWTTIVPPMNNNRLANEQQSSHQ